MTTKSQPTTPPDLASAARVIEGLLPVGMGLLHTRGRWYLKKWDSWIHVGQPRMGWRGIDSDPSLAVLLGRLGEPK